MDFNGTTYFNEMKTMVDAAIEKLLKEKPDYEVFAISIWTDANAAASSFNIDSKKNSDEKVDQSNKWSEKYYQQYIAEGDLEQAKLFEPTAARNCNPADFDLRDFEEINNLSIPEDWEEETEGQCWDLLDPILQQIGDYAFEKSAELKRHPDFELAVNGREDWYEFTWPKNKENG